MSAATSFLTGFMKTTGRNIGERKDEAKEYFDKRMEQAYAAAQEYKGRNKSKLDASLQVGKQLMAAGVPEDVVMAIANQNPDDMSGFFDLTQEMKTKGVAFTPQSYRDLAGLDAEFNAGGENLTGLLRKIYTPLVGNVNADPQSWDFDPKGTMWATMMGYNAMEKAHQRLSSTEVLPGVSAAEVLADDGSPNLNPIGGPTPVVNATMVGDSTRTAAAALKGNDLSPTEITTMITQFQKMAEEERNKLLQADPTADAATLQDEANKLAAARMSQNYPDADQVPEISRWMNSTPPPTDTGAETVVAPESPTAPPTAPITPVATPVAPTPTQGSGGPPAGSQMVQDLKDGTAAFKLPDGSVKRYRLPPPTEDIGRQ